MTRFLRYVLIIYFLIMLLLFSEKAIAYQKDLRGFPITSSPGPSFGTPPVNSQFGAPQSALPAINTPHPVSNQFQHPHDRDHDRDRKHFHGVPYFFYYNNVYPFYYNVPNDDSYYHTTAPSDNNDNISGYEITSQPDNAYDGSLPEGIWVAASNGGVPGNAIVYQTNNNVDTYYCRAYYRDQMYYGVLTPDDACYIHDQSATIRFDQYEVLVSY